MDKANGPMLSNFLRELLKVVFQGKLYVNVTILPRKGCVSFLNIFRNNLSETSLWSTVIDLLVCLELIPYIANI